MLAFIHLQKAAGTSVAWILRSSFGPRHFDAPLPRYLTKPVFSGSDLRYWQRYYPRLESIAGHSVVPYNDLDEVCPNIKYFTLMREPVRRMASWYQYQVQQKRRGRSDSPFEDWIQKEFRHNWQTRRIAGTVDVDAAIQMIRNKGIFVGLVGSFDESMLLLKALVSDDLDIAYRRRNVARADTITENLLASDRARQMLIEANGADLELYDFVKSELYPSYRREYGASLKDDLAHYQTSPGRPNYLNVGLSRLKRMLLVVPLLYLRRGGTEV
jgi:hypothetical protein